MDVASLSSIIGALGVGSFVGQYLIGSQQRRQLRSDVLRHLSKTENNRWAGPSQSDPSRSDFTESVRELETAALIARTPRSALATYIQLAYAARNLSDVDVEESGGIDESGGINSELSALVREAASELSRLTWTPWLGRINSKRRSRELRQRTVQLSSASVKDAVERAVKYHTF